MNMFMKATGWYTGWPSIISCFDKTQVVHRLKLNWQCCEKLFPLKDFFWVLCVCVCDVIKFTDYHKIIYIKAELIKNWKVADDSCI